jgi:hypothetical protein
VWRSAACSGRTVPGRMSRDLRERAEHRRSAGRSVSSVRSKPRSVSEQFCVIPRRSCRSHLSGGGSAGGDGIEAELLRVPSSPSCVASARITSASRAAAAPSFGSGHSDQRVPQLPGPARLQGAAEPTGSAVGPRGEGGHPGEAGSVSSSPSSGCNGVTVSLVVSCDEGATGLPVMRGSPELRRYGRGCVSAGDIDRSWAPRARKIIDPAGRCAPELRNDRRDRRERRSWAG